MQWEVSEGKEGVKENIKYEWYAGKETLNFIENANKKSHENMYKQGDRDEKLGCCFCLS